VSSRRASERQRPLLRSKNGSKDVGGSGRRDWTVWDAMDGRPRVKWNMLGPDGMRGTGAIRLITQRSTGQGTGMPRCATGAAFQMMLNMIIVSEWSAEATQRVRTG
jgi:hypothetical protein